jgi:deoxycytidylate deaminase|tara:strand:+ start:1322 stop:1606 length:285 start_codon:yes stop_codon:yes gene_type:complete
MRRGKGVSDFRRKMKKVTLYIARLNMDTQTRKVRVFSHSAPCQQCLKFMKRCGIKKIVFSTNNAYNQVCSVKVSDFENAHVTWANRLQGVSVKS